MKLLTSAIIRKSSFFLLGGMTVAAGWGAMAIGDIFEKMSQPQPGNNPVAIHAAAPTLKESNSSVPFVSTSRMRTSRRGMAAPAMAGDNPTQLPSATMGSTSLFHHSGSIAMPSGSNRSITADNGGNGNMTVHSTAEEAKRTSGISRGGNLLALASATMITSPGASRANDISGVSTSSTTPGRPRRVTDNPGIPFPDPEVPVGPIPFVFISLLAIAYAAYAAFCHRRKRPQA